MLDRLPTRVARITILGVLLCLPLIFTTGNDELFEFPKMLVVYGAAIILAGCWAVETINEKKFRFLHSPFTLPILLFLGSQLLSTLFSIDRHTSLYGYYTRFNGGFFSVLAYVTFFFSVLRFGNAALPGRALRALLFGGVAASLYAFPEHYGHSPSCWLITGTFDVECWVQDVATRVFGTLGQPNWLAAYMVVLLPLTVSQALSSLKKKTDQKESIGYAVYGTWEKRYSILYTLYFILFTSVLLFTKSRSGILGAGVGLGLLTLGLLIHRRRTLKHSPFSMVALQLAAPLSVFVLLLVFISNPIGEKVRSYFPAFTLSPAPYPLSPAIPPSGTQLDSGGSESGDIRKVVWTGALRVWQRYPILGSGVETFAYSYYRDRPVEHNMLSEWDFLYNKAHNEFLNYLATTGAVGFLAYISMYTSFIVLPIIWSFTRKTQPSLSTIYYLLATASSLAGLSVSNFFGFSTVVVSLLTFVLPALSILIAKKEREFSIPFPPWLRGTLMTRIALASIVLVLFFGLSSIMALHTTDRHYAKAKTLLHNDQTILGVELLQQAVVASPEEPVYRDELALTAARLAYVFAAAGESTKAAQLAQAAIDHSDLVIAHNQVNVNFFKTRFRIFTLLASISPVFYDQAETAIQQARLLSPTDPKLPYSLALIAKAREDYPAYEQYLRQTLALRPIDIQAQLDLATLYHAQGKKTEATAAYQQVLRLDPQNQSALSAIASLSGTIQK